MDLDLEAEGWFGWPLEEATDHFLLGANLAMQNLSVDTSERRNG